MTPERYDALVANPPADPPAEGSGAARLLKHWRLWPRKLLIGVVQAYRLLLKAWLGNACRFEPSCSAYTLQALQTHGALRGSALGGWRLLRCHPWCAGGLDPVPSHFSFRRSRNPPSADAQAWLLGQPGHRLHSPTGMFTGLVDPTEPAVHLQPPTMPEQMPPAATLQPRQPSTPPASSRTLS